MFFQRLRAPTTAGAEDSGKARSFLIRIVLASGDEVRCWSLPEDSSADIKRKLLAVLGKNVLEWAAGEDGEIRLQVPDLCALWGGRWVSLHDAITMQDLGLQRKLKFRPARRDPVIFSYTANLVGEVKK